MGSGRGGIYNPKAYKTTYSVSDFVDYVDATNAEYGGKNEGWSAWYCRRPWLPKWS